MQSWIYFPLKWRAHWRRQEEPLDLALGFIAESVSLQIAPDLSIGLTLTRLHHGFEESTQESGTSSCWCFGDKVALSDGG